MARAMSSLPVPVSPPIRTAALVGATTRTASQTWRRPPSAPIIGSVSSAGGGKLRIVLHIVAVIGFLVCFSPAHVLPGYSNYEATGLKCHHEISCFLPATVGRV